MTAARRKNKLTAIRKAPTMPTFHLRDCECDPHSRFTNLSEITIMFKCATCGDIDHISIVDVDTAVTALRAMRATAFPGRVTPEGVEHAEHAERPADGPRP